MMGRLHSDLQDLVGIDVGGTTTAELRRTVALKTLCGLRLVASKVQAHDRVAVAALLHIAETHHPHWERVLSSPWVASWAARAIGGEGRISDRLGNHILVSLLLGGVQVSGIIPLDVDGDCLRFSGENWHIKIPNGAAACATIDEHQIHVEIRSEDTAKIYHLSEQIIHRIPCKHEPWLVAHHVGMDWNRVEINNTIPVLADSLHAFLCGPTGPNSKSEQVTNIRDSDDSQMAFELVRRALSLIECADPILCNEVRGFLRLIVPLKKADRRFDFAVSFTLEDWPGAVFITTEEPLRYGELLVHETGHVKLYQTMLLDPLLGETSQNAMIFSPWRHELRPLSGILHGVYVHLRVARYYAGLMRCDAPDVDVLKCAERFDEVLRTLQSGMSVLLDQSDYTPLGRAMVLLMDENLCKLMEAIGQSHEKR